MTTRCARSVRPAVDFFFLNFFSKLARRADGVSGLDEMLPVPNAPLSKLSVHPLNKVAATKLEYWRRRQSVDVRAFPPLSVEDVTRKNQNKRRRIRHRPLASYFRVTYQIWSQDLERGDGLCGIGC
jgi:hypothetical protein